MPRPRTEDRSQVAEETLTIRLTAEESSWLDRLVQERERDVSDAGGRVTRASLVRSLIRREARAAKLTRT